MARLVHHQAPSPTVAASSTAAPAASSAMPAKALVVNHGVLNLQILQHARDNTYVNVDSGNETPRTEKRIFWTQEEDVRMMSSWLLNSTDSTVGANRKNEQYWTDVEATYNETTPSHRRRNAKQIKDRFHKAHVFYIKDNEKLNLGPFVLMEVWNTVKTEAKWITYNNGLKAARKRTATKGLGKEKEGEDSSPLYVDELDEQPRPMGQKRAKKLQYAQSKEVDHIDLEELDKFSKLQNEQNANRLKVLEIQQKLSSEKIEQTKISHLAANEQMEAAKVQREARKLEVEARMYETYNRLLVVDTSLMSDEEKVDHGNTLKFLKKKLFTDN
ncbi:glutathione S-transferase T3-like [Oryza glaberrima]|uniref:glutathione S-transferase T3-like n=1 Tax=Oryza glaberrima TaxID=4538 RepID=UPI00224BF392|nr:glutathione S-transferase T3-like [Oryza glaberrima]